MRHLYTILSLIFLPLFACSHSLGAESGLKALPTDALVQRESYGTAEGGAAVATFFDVEKYAESEHKIQCTVVGDELLAERGLPEGQKGILSFTRKITLPLTLDLSFRTESEPNGLVEFNLCHDEKISTLTIKGGRTISSGTESMEIDTLGVQTMRLVFNEDGEGTVYINDGSSSMNISRVPLNGKYTLMDIRLYGDVKLYIKEVALYDAAP